LSGFIVFDPVEREASGDALAPEPSRKLALKFRGAYTFRSPGTRIGEGEGRVTQDAASEQMTKLFNADTCLPQNRPKRPLPEFGMIWDRQTTMRFGELTNDHMASALVIEFIADLAEGFDDVSS
jgi:hypothetical protein